MGYGERQPTDPDAGVLDLPVAHIRDDEESEERSGPDRAIEVLPTLPETHRAPGN
jgi:hypothetical protein